MGSKTMQTHTMSPPVMRLLSGDSLCTSIARAPGNSVAHDIARTKAANDTAANAAINIDTHTDTDAELLLAAAVYQAWSNPRPAPWLSHDKGGRNRSVPTVLLKGAASVHRFDRQLRGVMKGVPDLPCFAGTEGTLTINGIAPKPRPFRICLVFWQPGFITAREGRPDARSAELQLICRLQKEWSTRRRAIDHGRIPLIDISVAYVLPRWKRSLATTSVGVSRESRLLRTDPRVLSYGRWQLGLRLCMLCPDVVMSTSGDVSRIVGSLGQEGPPEMLSAKLVAGLAQAPVLYLGGQQRVNGVRRNIAVNGPNRGWHNHSYDHFRCHHPVMMMGTMSGETAGANLEAHKLMQLAFTRTVAVIAETAIKREYCVGDIVSDRRNSIKDNRDWVVVRRPRKRTRTYSPPAGHRADAVEEIEDGSDSDDRTVS